VINVQTQEQSQRQIMKTKFTEMIRMFNFKINKQEVGSDKYKELCLLKYDYIKNC